MKQAFSLGCDFKEDGNGMPPSQKVGGADVCLGSKAQGIGLCQDRDVARRLPGLWDGPRRNSSQAWEW